MQKSWGRGGGYVENFARTSHQIIDETSILFNENIHVRHAYTGFCSKPLFTADRFTLRNDQSSSNVTLSTYIYFTSEHLIEFSYCLDTLGSVRLSTAPSSYAYGWKWWTRGLTILEYLIQKHISYRILHSFTQKQSGRFFGLRSKCKGKFNGQH